jgi:hypothetical protein
VLRAHLACASSSTLRTLLNRIISTYVWQKGIAILVGGEPPAPPGRRSRAGTSGAGCDPRPSLSSGATVRPSRGALGGPACNPRPSRILGATPSASGRLRNGRSCNPRRGGASGANQYAWKTATESVTLRTSPEASLRRQGRSATLANRPRHGDPHRRLTFDAIRPPVRPRGTCSLRDPRRQTHSAIELFEYCVPVAAIAILAGGEPSAPHVRLQLLGRNEVVANLAGGKPPALHRHHHRRTCAIRVAILAGSEPPAPPLLGWWAAR